MKKHLTLIVLIAFLVSESWASSYELAVGKRKVHLELNQTDWSDFCLKEKYGCARFFIGSRQNPSSIGFIKALSDRPSSQGELKNFCRETFEQTKKIVTDTKDFTFHSDGHLTYCSWSSSKEITLLTHKENITFMISASNKALTTSLLTMINRAKLYEKP